MTRSDRRAAAATVAVLSVCVVVAVALFLVGDAAAAYSNPCPSAPGAPGAGEITDDAIETRNQRIADVAICEALAERIAATNQRLDDLLDNDATTAAQRVALAPKDRERLDLIWYGAWASVGLLLVSLMAQRWYGSWRFLRD